MGVGGKFWDLLKPYARHEGVDFLRDKRVAIDLSFWIVQHEAAVRWKTPRARKPHLRATFFRTVALFAKMGAYPVFVLDGEPSPLKAQARIERFFRMSGLVASALPKPAAVEEETPVKQRNQMFTRCVQECVELLKLLGMPVLRAHSEAEALCAKLNSEGHVDACITADSDAFLFGAKCVIKCLRSNSKEPFECYYLSDIERGLRLKRKQMIAIALLVGNDHDLHGVPGFGVDTAVRLVQSFSEDEVLNRLCEISKGDIHVPDEITKSPNSVGGSANAKSSHCSNCGHPGSKKAHLKIACDYCILASSENCMKKPLGFKCPCPTCDEGCKIKEQHKQENWRIKLCKNIYAEENFPNKQIIELYLHQECGVYNEKDGPCLRWDKPDVECLVDFLTYHQHWEPSYIRQRMLSMLSTIHLREIASRPNERLLLYDQYEFHAIQRVKIRYGHPYYLIKWKKAAHSSIFHTITNVQTESDKTAPLGDSGSADLLDEPNVPLILIDDGCSFLLTDENMGLVQAAFPKEVDRFTEEKRSQELSSIQNSNLTPPKPGGVQLSITDFYRSSKTLSQAKPVENPEKNPYREESRHQTKKKSADWDKNLSKSVRRRLLFD